MGTDCALVGVDVFGPTTLRIDGEPVALGRPQVATLVAALVADRGEAASVDRLVHHLWPRQLPDNPRKALNVALSRLRTSLGRHAGHLVSVDGGYRLDALVDLDRFEDLVDIGLATHGAAAIATLSEALTLARSEPFASAPDADSFLARRSSLSAMRWSAVAHCADSMLAEGQNDAVVALTSGVADDDVVRERIVIARARALAACGQRSEALAETSRAIGRLRDAQGLDPSAALLAVEREILTGALDMPAATPALEGAQPSAFIGRRDDLMRLAGASPSRAVAVVAEAGMGKSALLDEFVDEQRRAGRRVIRATATSAPERAMDTVAQICLAAIEHRHLDDVEPSSRGALRRICPEFVGDAGEDNVTRDSMIDALVRLIEAETAGSIVVLDDAQWLDGGSASVVERLIRRANVTVVMAMRPTDQRWLAFMTDDGAASTAEAGTAGRCISFDLRALTTDEVAELIEASGGSANDERLAERLAHRSGGNALLLRLLIEEWIEGGQPDGPLPSSVLLAVTRRLDELSQSTRQTLDIAACMGVSFDTVGLVDLRPSAHDDLESAVRAGIISMDESTERGSFRHALVADACRELISPGRVVAIHDDLGRSMEQRGLSAVEFARHYVEAAPLDPRRAILACLHAAAEFSNGFDWSTAHGHLDAAVDVASAHGVDRATEAQLTIRLGIVERALGLSEYVDRLIAGSSLARDVDDVELFVVAVVELCGRGATTTMGSADARVRTLLDEALALDVGPAVRAELCAAAAPLLAASDERRRGQQLFHEAWRITRDLGDDAVEAEVLAHAHVGFSHPDDLHMLMAAADRMAALAGDDSHLVWEAARLRFESALTAGDPEATQHAMDVMRAQLPDISGRLREHSTAFCESAHAMIQGDLETAEVLAADVLALGLELFDPSWATVIHGMLLTGLRWEQGRIGELAERSAESVRRRPGYIPSRGLASLIALEIGDHDASRRHLDVLCRNDFADLERNMTHTAMLVLAAPAVAALGQPAERRRLLEILRPYSGRLSWNIPSSRGAVDRALGVLVGSLGDADDAKRYDAAADRLVASFRRSEIVGHSALTG